MINAQKLKEVADLIKKEIPGLGFALITFEMNTTGLHEFRYISNAQRAEMIDALEGILNKWKNETPLNN